MPGLDPLEYYRSKISARLSIEYYYKLPVVITFIILFIRINEEPEEVFPVRKVVTMLDDSQCVSQKFDSGNYISFQIDSGAQCNVLLLHMTLLSVTCARFRLYKAQGVPVCVAPARFEFRPKVNLGF